MGAANSRAKSLTSGAQAAAAQLGIASSRTRYAAETGAAALATGQHAFPGWLTSSLGGGVPLGPGQSLVRLVGDHEAAIKGADGRGAVVISSLPLVGDTPTGARAPVDLSAEQIGGAYQARSTAVPVSMPTTASGETRFLNAGFGFGLAGATSQTADLTQGRLFYPNVNGASQNTDAVLQDRPNGVEVSWILRSANAPEDHALKFNLPAGAVLKLIGGQDIVQINAADGSPLGFVSPPTAVDAAGRPVPSSYSLSGPDTLVLHVAHQEGSYAYPILADPFVAAYAGNIYYNWAEAVKVSYSFAFTFANQYSFIYGPSCPTGTCSGYWGEYTKLPIGGAYIYDEYLSNVYHIAVNDYESSGLFTANGFYAPGTWADTELGGASGGPYAFRFAPLSESNVTADFCASGTTTGPGTCPIPAEGAVAPGDEAVIGDTIAGATASGPVVWLYGAYLYESDDNNPTITSVTHSGYTPGQWVNSSFTDNVTLTGGVPNTPNDPTAPGYGLGMGAIAIGTNGTNVFAGAFGQASAACPNNTYPCNQTQTSTLAYSSAQLPEGSTTLYAQANSAAGHSSSPAASQWTVNIDRTAPVVGGLSGSLYDHRNLTSDHRQEGLYGSVYHLTVPATDSLSGVQRISVNLTTTTGTFVAALGSVSQTNNTAGASLTLDSDLAIPSSVADGDYNVVATAVDAAGNTQNQQFTVTLDRIGDVYHAKLLTGDPSAGGKTIREEWFQFGTENARAVMSDSIKTRGVVPCPTNSLFGQSCAEVRDENPLTGSYFVTTGSSTTDPNIQDVTQLYASSVLAGGTYAGQATLVSVMQPWQHAPPVHSAYADEYVGPSSSLPLTVWVDHATQLPIRFDSTQANGTVSSTYVDYDVARKLTSEEPADLFGVTSPSQPSITDTQTFTGSTLLGSILDLATHVPFVSYFLGQTNLIGSLNLCLLTSDIVNETTDGLDQQTSVLGEPIGPQGPSTISDSYYTNGSCTPGAGGVDNVSLLVATTTSSSPTAQAWRGDIQTYAQDIQADPTDPNNARGGVISVTVGSLQLTAYVIPLDGTRLGAVIDINGTTVQIIGNFAKTDVIGLVEALITH